MLQFFYLWIQAVKSAHMKLIKQGKLEGILDNDISSESISIYIHAINKALQSNLSKKVQSDLGKLFFYGLFGSSN